MCPSKLDHVQNPPSKKNYDLYPNVCNDESNLHLVLSVCSIPPESVENEDQKLQNLVEINFLPPKPI